MCRFMSLSRICDSIVHHFSIVFNPPAKKGKNFFMSLAGIKKEKETETGSMWIETFSVQIAGLGRNCLRRQGSASLDRSEASLDIDAGKR